jgi:hypothetical protein
MKSDSSCRYKKHPVNCLLTFWRWILMHGSKQWGSVLLFAWGNVSLPPLVLHQVLQISLYSCWPYKYLLYLAVMMMVWGVRYTEVDCTGQERDLFVHVASTSRWPCLHNRYLQKTSRGFLRSVFRKKISRKWFFLNLVNCHFAIINGISSSATYFRKLSTYVSSDTWLHNKTSNPTSPPPPSPFFTSPPNNSRYEITNTDHLGDPAPV